MSSSSTLGNADQSQQTLWRRVFGAEESISGDGRDFFELLDKCRDRLHEEILTQTVTEDDVEDYIKRFGNQSQLMDLATSYVAFAYLFPCDQVVESFTGFEYERDVDLWFCKYTIKRLACDEDALKRWVRCFLWSGATGLGDGDRVLWDDVMSFRNTWRIYSSRIRNKQGPTDYYQWWLARSFLLWAGLFNRYDLASELGDSNDEIDFEVLTELFEKLDSWLSKCDGCIVADHFSYSYTARPCLWPIFLAAEAIFLCKTDPDRLAILAPLGTRTIYRLPETPFPTWWTEEHEVPHKPHREMFRLRAGSLR